MHNLKQNAEFLRWYHLYQTLKDATETLKPIGDISSCGFMPYIEGKAKIDESLLETQLSKVLACVMISAEANDIDLFKIYKAMEQDSDKISKVIQQELVKEET